MESISDDPIYVYYIPLHKRHRNNEEDRDEVPYALVWILRWHTLSGQGIGQ